MQKFKKIVLGVLILLVLALLVRLVWFFAAYYMNLDFSQEYRKFSGYGDIVFVQRDTAYKRVFWGLKKIDYDVSGLDEYPYSPEAASKVSDLVGKEYYKEKCQISPDGKWILYEESHPWGQGAPTDDEDIYYKVVDTKTGDVITIFKAPMQRYRVYWR